MLRFIPSYTLWVMPHDSAKWKTLLRYNSAVSFIRIAVVVVMLLKIQHPWNGPFLGEKGGAGVIRTLTPPNIVWSCWNFEQGYSSNKTNTVFEKFFKILNLDSSEKHPKFTVLVHFGLQVSPGKPKNLPKMKISAKTESS